MYQPFIGRKEELDALEKLYETEGFQMMVVYGRRIVACHSRGTLHPRRFRSHSVRHPLARGTQGSDTRRPTAHDRPTGKPRYSQHTDSGRPAHLTL